MPRIPNGVSAKRINMRQVAAYIYPSLALLAYRKAVREKKTNQQIVAEAIETTLNRFGVTSPLVCDGLKLIRRSANKRAQIKMPRQTTRTRVNKIFIGGWFPKQSVAELNEVAKRLKISIQKMVVLGLESFVGDDNAGVAR